MRTRVFVLSAIFVFCFSGFAFAAGTREEANMLVEKASSYYKAQGKETAFKEFNNPKGQFVKDDLYVFVYDVTATIIAHPHSPALIGKNLYDVTDFEKKYFRRDIVNIAKTKGSGWVDYTYKNPQTNKIENKTTYLLRVGDSIICCGAYK